MIDFLPRLLCALATPSLAGRRLVVAAQRTAFEQETIDLVDTPAERLVSVPYPAVVECADLVTLDFGARPTAVTGMPVMFRGATPLPVLSALRSRLLSALRIAPRPNAAGGRRLFVVRRDVQRPRLINEAEIADTLAGLGFEAVALSGQSVAAQAALFAEAEIIVGAHGAGLTNALFAPNGAALLELHGVSERPDFFERIGDEKRFWHRFATDPARVHAAAVALLDGSRPCPRG
jgi:capsular polysaccharide biosynthesis protein